MEHDGETSWKDALTNMFECYFDLLSIMGDRASSQPKFTNGNPSDLNANPDEEEDNFHPCDRPDDDSVATAEEPVVAVDSPVVPPVVDDVVAAVAADGVPAIENAVEKPATKKSRAPRPGSESAHGR